MQGRYEAFKVSGTFTKTSPGRVGRGLCWRRGCQVTALHTKKPHIQPDIDSGQKAQVSKSMHSGSRELELQVLPESPKAVFDVMVTRLADRAVTAPDSQVLQQLEPAASASSARQSPCSHASDHSRGMSPLPSSSVGAELLSDNRSSRLPRTAAARCRDMFTRMPD